MLPQSKGIVIGRKNVNKPEHFFPYRRIKIGAARPYFIGHIYSVQWSLVYAFNPSLRSSGQPQHSTAPGDQLQIISQYLVKGTDWRYIYIHVLMMGERKPTQTQGEHATAWRMPSGGQLVMEQLVNWKPPFLVDLITNFCIPFILPLALQTRQFTKRQLRSHRLGLITVFSWKLAQVNLQLVVWKYHRTVIGGSG